MIYRQTLRGGGTPWTSADLFHRGNPLARYPEAGKGGLAQTAIWFRGDFMLEKISSMIDAFNRKEGEWSALLIIPLTVVVIYEVIMRYVFDAPTIWGFEATTFHLWYPFHARPGLYGCDGRTCQGGYLYLPHAAVNPGSSRHSDQSDYLFARVFLYDDLGLEICHYIHPATELNSTSWAPPVWPIKLIMAVAFQFSPDCKEISTVIKAINTLSSAKKA